MITTLTTPTSTQPIEKATTTITPHKSANKQNNNTPTNAPNKVGGKKKIKKF
jgi:hypothetical protein